MRREVVLGITVAVALIAGLSLLSLSSWFVWYRLFANLWD